MCYPGYAGLRSALRLKLRNSPLHLAEEIMAQELDLTAIEMVQACLESSTPRGASCSDSIGY
jgi:hypothetical protein